MSILDIRQWNYPTRVVFGAGAIERLPHLCQSLGMKAPLLVTDAGLKDAGITQNALSLVRDAGLGVEIFSDVKGNPTASVSYTHLRAHETDSYLVCRLLLEKT